MTPFSASSPHLPTSRCLSTGSLRSRSETEREGDTLDGSEREAGRRGVSSASPAAAEKVFVAVPQEHKAGKGVLAWALAHLARPGTTVFVCHVHVPPQMIPMMGTKFHASKMRAEEVRAYRQSKLEEVHEQLDAYLRQCSKMKVKAEKLVLENNDIVQGLVQLIAQYGVTTLVMGAAADKHYSKKMKSPKSKTATGVLEKADPSCRILFVCKENLIFSREAGLVTTWGAHSPSSGSDSISEISYQLRSQSFPHEQVASPNFSHSPRDIPFMQRSASDRTGTEVGTVRKNSRSRLSYENNSFDSWDDVSRSSFVSSYQASSTTTDEVLSDYGFSPFGRGNGNEVGSEVLPSILECDTEVPHESRYHDQEEMGLDMDLLVKLQEAYAELENLRKKAYGESSRRNKAEEELIKYRQKTRKYEEMYFSEVHKRKETEEMFGQSRQEIERLKQALEFDKPQRDCSPLRADEQTQQLGEVIEHLEKHKLALEQRAANAESSMKSLQGELAAARYKLDVQQATFKEIKQERDAAIRKLQELDGQTSDISDVAHGVKCSEFTMLELEQATHSFCDLLMIGEGGFGRVYKGFLRGTIVAVKILHHDDLQGHSQLQQEVVVLSRVRHPNLVALIGARSAVPALVYEFCDNGSLEDRLKCKDDSPPLSWQVRVRIIREIFSALIFLQSAKPHPIVHGDLKPENILLDANLVSKLSDFGISRILTSNTNATTMYYTTNPRGTFLYMDPEFLTTGELTPRSDVYSFGIIILRLLTGRPPLAIARDVENALEANDLLSVLDKSAGEWPFDRARQLAVLGLRCVELSRKNRPNFMDEDWQEGVWRVTCP